MPGSSREFSDDNSLAHKKRHTDTKPKPTHTDTYTHTHTHTHTHTDTQTHTNLLYVTDQPTLFMFTTSPGPVLPVDHMQRSGRNVGAASGQTAARRTDRRTAQFT